jgi:hypothetical protein
MSYDNQFTVNSADFMVMVNAALDCLEWSEIDMNSGEPLDSFGLYFCNNANIIVQTDLKHFCELAGDNLNGLDLTGVGHDFILTRNGHGAGFWDRGLGERGELLSSFAHSFGDINAFVSDSGDFLDAE